jgi:sulfur-oxidizing protein SoxX
MQGFMHKITSAVSVAALAACLGMVTPLTASADEGADIIEGKALSFNRKKGNCLACHAIKGGSLPGNIGPPLVAMKSRYPDAGQLRDQIADARTKNPNTIMIPFGPHAVLSGKEIDLITKYIYTL